MERSSFFVAAFLAITLGTAAPAEQIPVKHIQLPRHRVYGGALRDWKNHRPG